MTVAFGVARRQAAFLATAALVGSFGACSSFSSDAAAPDDAGTEAAVGPVDGAVDRPDAADAATALSYRDLVLSAKPLAYWRMGKVAGNVVSDESGHGNDLVLAGAPGFTTGVPGVIADDPDTAIRFDGLTGEGQALMPRAFDFPGSVPFSVEAWARHEPVEADGGYYFQHLVAHVEGSSHNRAGFSLYTLPTTTTDVSYTSFDIYGRPDLEQAATRRPAVIKGTWAHLVGVRDAAGMMTLYTDGVATVPVKAAGPITMTDAQLIVGGKGGGSDRFFGTIDEVAIYDRALSAKEVVLHSLRGAPRK